MTCDRSVVFPGYGITDILLIVVFNTINPSLLKYGVAVVSILRLFTYVYLLGLQNVKQTRKSNQKWTIQRQDCTQVTERIQPKRRIQHRKLKRWTARIPPRKTWCSRMGKKFLFIIRHLTRIIKSDKSIVRDKGKKTIT